MLTDSEADLYREVRRKPSPLSTATLAACAIYRPAFAARRAPRSASAHHGVLLGA